MTIPTPEQLADVLPRVAAGIDGGNWTKQSARLDWATRVLKYVVEAMPDCPDSALCAPESDEQGSGGTPVPPNTEEDVQATIDWLRSLRRSNVTTVDYYDGSSRSYEGAMRVVKSNDWPRKGRRAMSEQAHRYDALTIAILRAVGLSEDGVTGIDFSHHVGEVPRLIVTHVAWNADTEELEKTRVKYVPEEAQ